MDTREKILVAAATIMRGQGYARATTKEIARAAGYSEATLYKHFPDKTEIFLAVLSEQLPGLSTLLDELEAGRRTVRRNLTVLARTALDFYLHSFPIASSVFSARELLETHSERVRERGAGPRKPLSALAGYLREEQQLGRVRRGADPEAAAALLLGACMQQAMLLLFEGEPVETEKLDALAASLAGTLLGTLRPANR
ncbi:TetR family transcriptional regulator [Amycolatopsis antarctica]|uniref:TetR family transcriptional regulator n=1 Tax=Amycolatopsis antarctica TaxID=1854586 RepID=A0A263D4A0_9PSEU|nr:TetR/AcrR family transcriptional regulator [Amycolatopsis antarctica]OZM73314.1 TetR family transcriptional regulator [Amycolatopsis antarctica]